MQTPLPEKLYTGAQVRELDRRAIQDHGIPGYTLMERAGQAAFNGLRMRWPHARRIGVLCGPGNNGGDGYVIARLAHTSGIHVWLVEAGNPDSLQGDAARAEWAAAGGSAVSAGVSWPEADVLVDALLGTGLDRAVGGPMAGLIDAVNATGLPVLAVDIPSGLHADTGAVMGCAVHAALTVTFIGLKTGLFTGAGPDCCGRVVFEALEVPAGVYDGITPAAERLDSAYVGRLMPRPRGAHKGSFGHVLVVGGDQGMPGAARLAGEAAARTGAGLVSVATHPDHAPLLPLTRPELMVHAATGPADLAPLLARATVAAVGPGLGRGHWGRGLLGRLLECGLPMVLDADALNLLAAEPLRRDDWVLTPHPGEAARLLGCDSAAVQADRPGAAARIVGRFGGVCVLKGAGTLVHDGELLSVCTGGNPGMASGGMGDVLTGIIAALMAQGFDPGEAARLGVCAHAEAADRAARAGERGLLASDVIASLREVVNP
jgi:ADP-dependent NAD(P)H-hydrate dehydratase / NAD(P)H-hydrate epimerase